jgi:hypothetical protein
MQNWKITLETAPNSAMHTKILAPLVAHNEGAAGPGDWSLLVVTVRDAAGEIVGGLWGRAGYGFFVG